MAIMVYQIGRHAKYLTFYTLRLKNVIKTFN